MIVLLGGVMPYVGRSTDPNAAYLSLSDTLYFHFLDDACAAFAIAASISFIRDGLGEKNNFSIPLLVVTEIFGWLQLAAILTFHPNGCLDEPSPLKDVDGEQFGGGCVSRPHVQRGAHTV